MAGTLKIRAVPRLAARYSDQERWLRQFRKSGLDLEIGADWFDNSTIARRQEVLSMMRDGEDPEFAASEFVERHYPKDYARAHSMKYIDEKLRRRRTGR